VRRGSIAGILATGFDTQAQIVAVNSGSLGPIGNGVHLVDTGFTTDDPLLAPGGVAAVYSSSFATGSRTEVPFLTQLNPAASAPFTDRIVGQSERFIERLVSVV
jgi:hypothetical protein